MSPLELIELIAVASFLALALAAGVTAIVRNEKPLRLLWIAGIFLLLSLCIAAGNNEALDALVNLFRR
ncbi:hypothetical protein ACIA5G_05420 [Amycolatopsis sp. NPDC051758]|uniref:hypothetical protein n=1 Tax=Amycolatopsis sp. NPDC051758 TaxID=3363935 RepID=UPI0037891E12